MQSIDSLLDGICDRVDHAVVYGRCTFWLPLRLCRRRGLLNTLVSGGARADGKHQPQLIMLWAFLRTSQVAGTKVQRRLLLYMTGLQFSSEAGESNPLHLKKCLAVLSRTNIHLTLRQLLDVCCNLVAFESGARLATLRADAQK